MGRDLVEGNRSAARTSAQQQAHGARAIGDLQVFGVRSAGRPAGLYCLRALNKRPARRGVRADIYLLTTSISLNKLSGNKTETPASVSLQTTVAKTHDTSFTEKYNHLALLFITLCIVIEFVFARELIIGSCWRS
jgi:hypothetical protein